MPGKKTPQKKTGQGVGRDLDAGPLQPMVGSFELHLRAERKSPKTIRTYTEAAQWLAAEYLVPGGITDWGDVRARHVQEWTVILLGRYSDSYANNQFRALQQFFKWHATEDPDEPRSNPMASLKPPRVGEKLVPVFTGGELAAVLADALGIHPTTAVNWTHDAGSNWNRYAAELARNRNHQRGE